MRWRSLKERIVLTLTFLGLSVLLVWIIFYGVTAHNLRLTHEQNIRDAAGQIVDEWEQELLRLSDFALSLSQREELRAFVAEPDPLTFHEKSGAVHMLIDTMSDAATPVDHLIVYNNDGAFIRFESGLSNSSCAYLGNQIRRLTLPYYTATTLEGVRYIGYTAGVYDGSASLGSISLLVKEDRLLSLFERYNASGDLLISLLENGVAVASNDTSLLGTSVDEMEQNNLFLRRKVGFAPFEICIMPKEGYLSRVHNDLIVPMILTVVVFITLFALFLRTANRHFFRPMLSVMDKVKSLRQPEANRLDKTGEETFDALVEQVNLMLDRMDDLRAIELERQKSLVVSLKKQINAHFTVNILSAINQLIKSGENEKGGRMTEVLSSLLQYVNAGDEYIGVMDELSLLQKYVAMMEILYKSSFDAKFDWDEGMMDTKIHRMLLQPIVENAIVHGLRTDPRGGQITVAGRADGAALVFTITDNGAGINDEDLTKLRNKIAAARTPAWHTSGISSIALENIERRVWSCYGEGFGLRIDSKSDEGTCVALKLPLEFERGDELV